MLTELKKYFTKCDDVAFAFLFGSHAKGTTHKHSDVDIAVYFYPGVRFPVQYEEEIYFAGENEIWADLDRLLGKEVELLVLNRAASVICASAVRGSRLVINDWNLYLDFVEAVSREAEDFMLMRTKNFLERCTA